MNDKPPQLENCEPPSPTRHSKPTPPTPNSTIYSCLLETVQAPDKKNFSPWDFFPRNRPIIIL